MANSTANYYIELDEYEWSKFIIYLNNWNPIWTIISLRCHTWWNQEYESLIDSEIVKQKELFVLKLPYYDDFQLLIELHKFDYYIEKYIEYKNFNNSNVYHDYEDFLHLIHLCF